MNPTIAIVILAAGKSSRLGQPKQLLPFKGKSLLIHVVQIAKQVSENVFVIIGSDKKKMEAEIKNEAVDTVFNEAWEEGMASSIRCGLLRATEKIQDLGSVIFMVCDQPFVTTGLLQNLVQEKERSGKAIVASAYAEIAGTPVLFDKSVWPELMELQGDIGARKIIVKNKERVATIDFPLGKVDMDTAEDYRKLLLQKDLI
ncbi:nucleotidyltransferase family protein [Dyadobacter sp. LHD-138]|uniref:nucleotidyltransferase family protein n=1 Tax=Dyadobacter sp. LHD-138 TaxID=3071413 RepID=UPI0027E063E1|nr:nucleotidyltransferase family protein [Dyadobacter sp. LHD-138]MDQ6479177.1 nucleotidyltransferase family protein [Dyadobacter sp. LHD-138]